jgi:DNA polymerase V
MLTRAIPTQIYLPIFLVKCTFAKNISTMRVIEKPVKKQGEDRISLKIPFFDTGINAGFPSPALDYHENDITADELLGLTPTCFLSRINGPSMEGADMPHGSIIIIDRGIKASSGDIVVAVLNNEFTVKRYIKTPAGLVLHPENPLFKPYLVQGDDHLEIWGVVTGVYVKKR